MLGKRHTEITQRQSVVVKAGEKIRGGNKRVRGGKGTADATMRILRAAFNYGLAMYEDTFVRNPVAVLKAIGTWHNLGRRETSVTTDKLKSWFAGVRSIENPAMRVILEVSIFTGARKDEVQSLQWSDVNIDAETPYANFRDTKNGKELLIPLAGHVVKLLKDYKAIAFSGPDGFLFPSWGKSGHIKDPRRAIENAVKAGSAHFIPHDNRRSFLSFCNHEDLQIPVWTQKRLCNHAKPQDVTQGYVQHELKSLQQTVERVAGFILKHADIDGRTPETKGSEQAGKVVNLAERRRKKRAA
jgi:integrase